jgi:hypothetical protein
MIIILADRGDSCAQGTYQCLLRRGSDALFLDEETFLDSVGLSWSLERPGHDGYLLVDGRRISLVEGLSGVLLRTGLSARVDHVASDKGDRDYVSEELQATVNALFKSLRCRVVNRPSLGRALHSVMADLHLRSAAASAGVRLPVSMMTSDREQALQFCAHHGYLIVAQSPSGTRRQRLLRGEEAARAYLDGQAVVLQEVPAGQWIEVFAIGDQAIGVESALGTSPETANQGHPGSEVALPPVVSLKICQFARRLNLELACVRVLVGNDSVHCFHVDPMPSLSWCEPDVRGRITTALAAILERGPDDRPS